MRAPRRCRPRAPASTRPLRAPRAVAALERPHEDVVVCDAHSHAHRLAGVARALRRGGALVWRSRERVARAGLRRLPSAVCPRCELETLAEDERELVHGTEV